MDRASRKERAKQELGLKSTNQENKNREIALAKEKRRQEAKIAKREALLAKPSYQLLEKTASIMDRYFIDPIIGFLLPGGIGDAISSIFAMPFIYFSLFEIKSIPLTLAVVYNTLLDVLVGAIPFYIGDILDIFKRSYLKNLKLITGFVNDDYNIIEEVNRTAIKSAILIAIICFLIYLLVSWTIKLGTIVYDYIASLFA